MSAGPRKSQKVMGMDVDEEHASMVKKVLYSAAAYFALFILSIGLDLVSHLTCSKEQGRGERPLAAERSC